MRQEIIDLLGESKAEDLLNHRCKFSAEQLTLPSSDFVDQVFLNSDRSNTVLNNLERLFSQGNLSNTGYLFILPVDQGVEHSAGSAFSPNPIYFNPENIIDLALEAGANAVASTLGVLGMLSRKYAHKIPFILKLNHNELLSYPNTYDQIMFAQVDQAVTMGALGVGATIYFGAENSNRQLVEVSKSFKYAHEKGLFTVLWCYLRNSSFKLDGVNYESSSDLTGQANHLGATIEADIVKQKQPDCNGGFKKLKFGKYDERMYSDLVDSSLIDYTRYQVMNSYMGKVGLINSGGSSGDNDLVDAISQAIVNKRAGGMGLICGRKSFQKTFKEGVNLIHQIQKIYLSDEVDIA